MNEYIFINIVVLAVILLISQFIVWLAKKSGKHLSFYKVFGIADVLWGAAILIIAVIEFITPGGDLHGLFGTVMLLIFEPGVILFLIVDIVLYRKQLKKDTERENNRNMS